MNTQAPSSGFPQSKELLFQSCFVLCPSPSDNSHLLFLNTINIHMSGVTWSLTPLSPVLVFCCALQVKQDWTWGKNRKYCRVWKMLCIAKWFASSYNLYTVLTFLRFKLNREAYRYFFSGTTPFPFWRELEHFTSRKVSRNIAHLAALTGMNTVMKSWSDISTDFAKKNHAIKFYNQNRKVKDMENEWQL